MPSNPGERRFWYCGGNRDGHVVGEIVRKELQDVGHVTALLVYESSLDVPPPDFVPQDRGMIVTGYELSCTICGRKFEWYPSLESLRRMMRRYGGG